MTKYMRTGLTVIAGLFGVALVATQASAQQAAPQQGACPAPAAGRGGGQAAAPAMNRVLAWSETRDGKAQKDYLSHALSQLERKGYESGAYQLIIRTDSNIISFNPKMMDGKTPASGGPSLCNIDAIVFAVHRNVPLDPQQQKDLISAIRDRGVGFVSLFVGMLPVENFPEMANILGAKAAAVDVHDPWGNGDVLVNESPDSPFTKHLPAVWNLPTDSSYHPEFYSRGDIQVLLRKDLSKLPTNPKYTRTDGDYPVAWTKMYGKGRVFVSTLGHNVKMWDDPNLLTMYDEAIKWSLGATKYDVKPHPLPAGVRGPSGAPAPAAAAPARGNRQAASAGGE
jgi:type 1 glutamine amidotransferase